MKGKRLISLFLSAIMLLSCIAGLDFSAHAYYSGEMESSGYCGADAYYSFDSSTGALRIYGSGAVMCDAFSYQGDIKTVSISDSITSLSNYAFKNCTNLTTVRISSPRFTSIKEEVFYNCFNLESINLPDRITEIGQASFVNCKNLQSLTIPEGMTRIEDWTFDGCSSLTELTIPDNVTYIGEAAFAFCNGLTNLTLGSGVNSIGDESFSNCTNLTSLTLNCENLASIDEKAFYNTSNIKDVYVNSIKFWCDFTYPKNPINGIDNLYLNGELVTNLVIPDDVTTIGNSAFYKCKGLTNVVIGTSVTSIGERAFFGCPNLNNIYYVGTESEWNKINLGAYIVSNNTIINFHEHTNEYTYEIIIEPTCTTDGAYDEVVYCTVCNEELSRDRIVTTKPHTYKAINNNDGTHSEICAECGDKRIDCEPHNFVKNSSGKYVCSVCNYEYAKANSKSVSTLKTGNTFYMGNYPQTQVTDSALVAELDKIECCLTSYNYQYDYGAKTVNMRYADIRYNGKVYRKVFIGEYRPSSFTASQLSDAASYQDENGYLAGNSYYFKWEPIRWTVLGGNTTYTYAITKSILDAQPINIDPDGATWETATIRQWLNDDFYNEAFSQMEKMSLVNDTHANEDNSNGISGGNSTTEKVSLLSYPSSINSSYGFNTTANTVDTARIAQGTGYAMCQGLNVITGDPSSPDNSARWWLRSIGGSYNSGAHVAWNGRVYYTNGNKQYIAYNGIRPVIKLAKSDVVGSADPATPAKVVHNYVFSKNTATCTEAGLIYHECTNCTDVITFDAEALGHNYREYVNNNDATCTENATETKTCDRCGDQQTRTVPNSALGHSYGEFVNNKNASCTQNATETAACSVCGDRKTQEIENSKLGHIYRVESNTATCTEAGICVYACVNCGLTYSEEMQALGHDYGEWTVSVQPSCISSGMIVRACEACAIVESMQLEKTDHNAEYVEEKPSTCSETGLTAGQVCSVCDAVISGREIIAKRDHTYQIVEELSQPASCTESGMNYYKCTVCGDSYTSNVPALTHNYSLIEHIESTVKTRGYDMFRCENCSSEYKDWFDYADNSALLAILVQASWITSGDFSASSYEYFKQIKDIATDLSNGDPTQSQIDKAIYDVIIAMTSLEPYANIGVTAENGEYTVSYDGNDYTDSSYSILYGTEVTLNVTVDDGYEFDGWMEQTTQKIVSTQPSYSFRATANMAFKPIINPVNSVTLKFANHSGQVIDTVVFPSAAWSSIASIDSMCPDVPYRYGYVDGRWEYDNAQVLAKLSSGEDVTLVPVYTEDSFEVPSKPSASNGVPALRLRYNYDGSSNVSSFILVSNVSNECRVNSIGIAYFSDKKTNFDPKDMLLTLYNDTEVDSINELDEDGIYILNKPGFNKSKNTAAVGYITYFDEYNQLKTVYSNQVNIYGREWVE